MSIALAMIAGGPDPIGDGLARAIRSARPYVDEVCVWTNGPRTEDVATLCRELDANVERGEWADDFAAARNASFGMCRADWILRMDADDVLHGAERLPEIVERAGSGSTIFAFYDCRGSDLRLFCAPFIVRRGSGVWRGAVHERWHGNGRCGWRLGVGEHGSTWVHPAHFRVVHRDGEPEYSKYLDALERAYRDDPERTPWAGRHLAGVVLAESGDVERAAALLEESLLRGWTDYEGTPSLSRAEALGALAGAYQVLGRWDDAGALPGGVGAPYARTCRVAWGVRLRSSRGSTTAPRRRSGRRWIPTTPH